MKIYIATPVNARKEATLEEKRKAAYERIKKLKELLCEMEEEAEFHSSFDDDIAPLDVELTRKMFGYELPSEAVIMGRCVQRVMECDMIILDKGWIESNGCNIEASVALIYKKIIKKV
jgi:hypothetical protein